MEIQDEKIAQIMKIYDGLKRSSHNFNRAVGEYKRGEGEVYLMYLDLYRKQVPVEVRQHIHEELFDKVEKECLELGLTFQPVDSE